MPCPFCGELISSNEEVVRRAYKKHREDDRARILKVANDGGDWLSLSNLLEIPRSTAEDWVKSGNPKPLPRGGYKNKILSIESVEDICDRGVPANRIVLVYDNAPVHSRFEQVAIDMGFELLRLGPYSPMLNPIENMWSVVKRSNRISVANGPGVGAQRIAYLGSERHYTLYFI